ncbi:MAG TPA: GNAT family N-acetyltransferase [Mycobacteriales bacterium]|nr:GNAT family N-acetyltransferase [Mycobacteriales bacterium]
MFRPRLPVRTSRLTLRIAVPGDLDAVHSYRSLPEVCRYLPFEPMTREQVADRVAGEWQRTELREPPDALNLVVVENASGRLIGDTMLRLRSVEDQHAEIGYVFHPDGHGRGYGTEAARELLRIGFTELGLHRMSADLDSRNGPSGRLLERLGMRREAHFCKETRFKGEWADRLVYAMLAEEWDG